MSDPNPVGTSRQRHHDVRFVLGADARPTDPTVRFVRKADTQQQTIGGWLQPERVVHYFRRQCLVSNLTADLRRSNLEGPSRANSRNSYKVCGFNLLVRATVAEACGHLRIRQHFLQTWLWNTSCTV
jgi:hypothetical protein